jgi:hypothetical protein
MASPTGAQAPGVITAREWRSDIPSDDGRWSETTQLVTFTVTCTDRDNRWNIPRHGNLARRRPEYGRGPQPSELSDGRQPAATAYRFSQPPLFKGSLRPADAAVSVPVLRLSPEHNGVPERGTSSVINAFRRNQLTSLAAFNSALPVE